jgi:hypothetical protein
LRNNALYQTTVLSCPVVDHAMASAPSAVLAKPTTDSQAHFPTIILDHVAIEMESQDIVTKSIRIFESHVNCASFSVNLNFSILFLLNTKSWLSVVPIKFVVGFVPLFPARAHPDQPPPPLPTDDHDDPLQSSRDPQL